ncbi:MAG: hypothetical protein ACFE9L_01775 [Candidatus Hodarchaeota archaeon]
MSKEKHQNIPTVRGNIAVGVFLTILVFVIFVFTGISVDKTVMVILIVWPPLLFLLLLYYYLMFKEIKKIQGGYYNDISV